MVVFGWNVWSWALDVVWDVSCVAYDQLDVSCVVYDQLGVRGGVLSVVFKGFGVLKGGVGLRGIGVKERSVVCRVV